MFICCVIAALAAGLGVMCEKSGLVSGSGGLWICFAAGVLISAAYSPTPGGALNGALCGLSAALVGKAVNRVLSGKGAATAQERSE